MQLNLYTDPADLPEPAHRLCDDAQAGDLFRSLPWLTRAFPAGLPPGDQLRLFLFGDPSGQAGPLVLLPAVYSRLYGSHPKARVLHLLQREEQPYEPLYGDVAAPKLAAEVAESLADWLEANPRAADVVRVSPLDPDAEFTKAVIAALSRKGHWVQLYRHARSRFASVGAMSSQAYLALRPRPLREALALHTRLLLQGGRGQFHFPSSPELVEDAWDTVRFLVDRTPADVGIDPAGYLRAVVDTAADAGKLRLGIFMLDGLPAAMQLWVINLRGARCLRIWEAKDQQSFPIDEILTQLIVICLIDGDRVETLDFGDINDEFAAEWAQETRDRIGVAAFSKRTWRGRRGAIRHLALPRALAAPKRWWNWLSGRR